MTLSILYDTADGAAPRASQAQRLWLKDARLQTRPPAPAEAITLIQPAAAVTDQA